MNSCSPRASENSSLVKLAERRRRVDDEKFEGFLDQPFGELVRPQQPPQGWRRPLPARRGPSISAPRAPWPRRWPRRSSWSRPLPLRCAWASVLRTATTSPVTSRSSSVHPSIRSWVCVCAFFRCSASASAALSAADLLDRDGRSGPLGERLPIGEQIDVGRCGRFRARPPCRAGRRTPSAASRLFAPSLSSACCFVAGGGRRRVLFLARCRPEHRASPWSARWQPRASPDRDTS